MTLRESIWFVRIDGWHPARLNELLNVHWATRHRRKRADANIIACSVHGADVPRATSPRSVALEIILAPGQRAADPDAYWKALLDGLVKCGALKDDSRHWCQLGPIAFVRGSRAATVIRLANLRNRGRPGLW